MQRCPLKSFSKARAILALRTLGWSQDNTRDVVECAKGKVGAVERWFEGLTIDEAVSFVAAKKLETVWKRSKFYDSGIDHPPSTQEILDKYHREEMSRKSTVSDYAKTLYGWKGSVITMASSSTGGTAISSTDFPFPSDIS